MACLLTARFQLRCTDSHTMVNFEQCNYAPNLKDNLLHCWVVKVLITVLGTFKCQSKFKWQWFTIIIQLNYQAKICQTQELRENWNVPNGQCCFVHQQTFKARPNFQLAETLSHNTNAHTATETVVREREATVQPEKQSAIKEGKTKTYNQEETDSPGHYQSRGQFPRRSDLCLQGVTKGRQFP